MAQVAQEPGPFAAGRARSPLRDILSPPRAKVPALIGAIEGMEDLVRRHCGRRDAQGNPDTLADDIRISSLDALLPEDLEKHVQLNRARLMSYVVLREEIKTYRECKGHAHARRTQHEGPVRQREAMDSNQDKNKDTDTNKDSIECWNSGKRGDCSNDCWSKKDLTKKDGSKGRQQNKQRTSTISTRQRQQTMSHKLKSVDST